MSKYYEDVINILATKIFKKIIIYCEKNDVETGNAIGIFINRLVKLSSQDIYIQKKDNINFCEEIERQKKLAENFLKQCTELELKLSHFMT